MVGTALARVARKVEFLGGPGALRIRAVCRQPLGGRGSGSGPFGLRISIARRGFARSSTRPSRTSASCSTFRRRLSRAVSPGRRHAAVLDGPHDSATRRRRSADYVIADWSGKAIPEARREGSVARGMVGEREGHRGLPSDDELDWSDSAVYAHYVSNETVEGCSFTGGGTGGCDSRLRHVVGFPGRPRAGLGAHRIYAHAQKNLGPAGVTACCCATTCFARAPLAIRLRLLDYRNHAVTGSCTNTPPVFAIYVSMLVTRWLRDEVGGFERDEMRPIGRRPAGCMPARRQRRVLLGRTPRSPTGRS